MDQAEKSRTERADFSRPFPSPRVSFYSAATHAVPRLFAAMLVGMGLYAAQGSGTAEARPRHKQTHSRTHRSHKSHRAPTGLVLKPAKFSDLPDWKHDRQAEAVIAFRRTCDRMLHRDGDDRFKPGSFAGRYKDWQPACRALNNLPPGDNGAARQYFETWFRPWLATVGGSKREGLFTGYYQVTLNGSRVKTDKYNVPLHRNPGADASRYTREQILEGRWPHNKDEDVLVWVDDKVSAYFLHVQGSGQVFFEDGTSMYVKYDGDNKRKFRGICLEFMERGILTRDTCSLQAIRSWIEAHKDTEDARQILESDPSYVFFRENPRGGSEGGEGVTLTPERSLAIDYTKIPYGMPLYINVENPVDGQPNLRRLMIGQDTGGAIRGAIRGDFFWGAGLHAESMAGRMKSKGGYWMLLPKELGAKKAAHKKTRKAEADSAPAVMPAAKFDPAAKDVSPVQAAAPAITDPVDPGEASADDAKKQPPAVRSEEERASAAHGREHKVRHRAHRDAHHNAHGHRHGHHRYLRY
jgi:membrane-bound lytic murein transglycosylase A